MKRLLIGLAVLVFLTQSLWASDLTYLKITNYESYMKKTCDNLEKLFMEDQVTFSGEGKKSFVEAWKLCQENQKYPGSGSFAYLAFSTRKTAIERATEALDTLAYDGLITFRTPEAKLKYREALKSLRIARDSL